jgi:xanthine dehydrogenase accessory factor
MRVLDVFLKIRDWIQQGERVWLCTVLGTWGSSPRPVGSLLACNAAGEFIGSLSGGCVEEDVLSRMVAGEFSAPVTRIRYGESPEEADRLRLPCGGILDVAIEKIQTTVEVVNCLNAMITALSERRQIKLCRYFSDGVWAVTESIADGSILLFESESDKRLLSIQQVFGPQYRLLLIGVSEVSRAVAQVASFMDYDILVCDPRQEARARWDISGVTLLAGMPDDVVREYGDDVHCAILALTHDPRIDDMGLMEAFSTKAFYIGAMGSLRTSQGRRERLLELGVSADSLCRMHAPIGLDTGSKTPIEIAVSVLAQLTAVRSGKSRDSI